MESSLQSILDWLFGNPEGGTVAHLNLSFVLNVLASGASLYASILVKGLVKNLAAWHKFKRSAIIGINSQIQVATASSSKQGVITGESNRKRIVVDFGETKRYYRPIDFMTDPYLEIVKLH